VSAGRFGKHGIETMPLQHGHGAARGFNQEVVFARGEPQELETFLQLGVGQRILVSLLPGRTAGCVRRTAASRAAFTRGIFIFRAFIVFSFSRRAVAASGRLTTSGPGRLLLSCCRKGRQL
jgi:hypothetical protein